MKGLVVDAPRLIDRKTQFELAEISVGNIEQSGKALVTFYGNNQTINFGDEAIVRCWLEQPQPIEKFRYERYLAKDNIVALCRQAEILFSEPFVSDWRSQPYRSLMSRLLSLKSDWRETLMRALPANEGSLLAGVMLGDGYLMSQEMKEAYSRSGLSHIVAISGMNMTMIAAFLLFCLVRAGMWRHQASLLAIILIWAYTLAIGLPSSAVRASVMSTLILFAYSVGRLARAERLLALAAALMLLLNPRLLRDDVGFQLSFLAFGGLMAYYEPIKHYLGRFLAHRYLQIPLEILSLTLAAQVLTWPILASNFGQVSWVAPFANLVVLWALGPLMVLAFFGLLLSYLIPPIWSLAPAFLLALYQNAAAEFFGGWPMSAINFEDTSIYLFILYYCGIMLITFRHNTRKNDQDTTC